MNRKTKIAILGAGNAACAMAFHYYYYGKDLFDITIYYDSSIPIERVGQGSLIPFSQLVYELFGLNWYDNNLIKATPKTGFLYENWGKKQDKIFHNFPMQGQSFHYVPRLLSNLLLECGFFKVVDKNILNPEEEVDADYIFDCRGKHNRDSAEYDVLTNPLNHVFLCDKEGADLTLTFTRCVATPDGWTFLIPNHDSVSYGYIFNDQVTSIENAKQNFIDLFDVVPDSHFHFENYIAKKCFVGERTVLNGNRLTFLEPLEATSVGFYLYVSRIIWDHIVNGQDIELCNQIIRNEMFCLQNFVLWHYQFGSKYDTDFWKYAKTLPFCPDENFNQMLNFVKDNDSFTCRNNKPFSYGQWTPHSFKVWYDNV